MIDVQTRWSDRIARHNDEVARLGRRRTIRTVDSGRPATTISADGRAVVSFASNDYLGLSQHPAVVAAAGTALQRDGAGAGSARLIVGARPVHDRLEATLAAWVDRDAALVFPSGYQANLGVLGALTRAAPDAVIYSDELNHASIIDGCRLARAETVVYRHGDVDHLRELLQTRPGRPAIVVTDGVFSMDGDIAPLDDLAALVADHDAQLVVDEAHAVLGPPAPDGAVVVGTLSKTLGAVGGFVAGDRALVDLLVSTARPFIFTTAGAPADAAAAHAALEVLGSEEGTMLVNRLRGLVDRLRPGHPSPILPVLLGDEAHAVAVADALLQDGLLVPAIRPPTVAPGTCRLRIALSAAHSDDQVDALRCALERLGVTP